MRVRQFTDGDWPRYTGDLAGRDTPNSNRSTRRMCETDFGLDVCRCWWSTDSDCRRRVLYASTRPASLRWMAIQEKKSGAMVQLPHLPAPVVADVEGRWPWRYAGDGATPAAQGRDWSTRTSEPARGAGDGTARARERANRHCAGGRRELEVALRGGGAPSSRGVAYWPGDATHPARILVMVGRRLARTQCEQRASGYNFRASGLRRYRCELGRSSSRLQEHCCSLGAANGEVTQGDSPGDTRAFDAERATSSGILFRSRNLEIPITRQPGSMTVGRGGRE